MANSPRAGSWGTKAEPQKKSMTKKQTYGKGKENSTGPVGTIKHASPLKHAGAREKNKEKRRKSRKVRNCPKRIATERNQNEGR